MLPRLRALDPVAYIRFASIYRDIRDLAGFVRELEAMGAAEGPIRPVTGGGAELGPDLDHDEDGG